MPFTNASFRIPFPLDFLPVNVPVQKATTSHNDFPSTISPPPVSAFLSNRPAGHAARNSVSSASEPGTISPPSSPPTRAAASPVLGPMIFAPLAVNTKHALPPQDEKEMSPVEKSNFLSNRL